VNASQNGVRGSQSPVRRALLGADHGRAPSSRLVIDPAVSARRTYLNLPDRLSIESWCRIGDQINCIADASAWWLGDWLIYGQDKYPDRYKRAMQRTNLDYQTLKNYAWLARKFEPSRRRDQLSFQHHVEVAARPVPEQDRWLSRAERFGWSRNELRRQLRAQLEQPADTEDERPQVLLRLAFNKQQVDAWQAAADNLGLSLSEWVSIVLDDASSVLFPPSLR
jgi:hypothetical protein